MELFPSHSASTLDDRQTLVITFGPLSFEPGMSVLIPEGRGMQVGTLLGRHGLQTGFILCEGGCFTGEEGRRHPRGTDDAEPPLSSMLQRAG